MFRSLKLARLAGLTTAMPRRSGDQNTAIEYTDGLDFIPDINTDIASFTLGGLQEAGPAIPVGTLAIQNFAGGTFSLYDSTNTLLLSGTNQQQPHRYDRRGWDGFRFYHRSRNCNRWHACAVDCAEQSFALVVVNECR